MRPSEMAALAWLGSSRGLVEINSNFVPAFTTKVLRGEDSFGIEDGRGGIAVGLAPPDELAALGIDALKSAVGRNEKLLRAVDRSDDRGVVGEGDLWARDFIFHIAACAIEGDDAGFFL